ncbi:hypothetical protein GGR23_002943 [Gellertiella hungarica]|uniref:Uncharacterized protein n=1 Tax=Gellertiella hungarica TaxID=1572859 RepID=A0A7W6J891_9HYPH|nr:hypothetical protein [Gellertiella hungarica]
MTALGATAREYRADIVRIEKHRSESRAALDNIRSGETLAGQIGHGLPAVPVSDPVPVPAPAPVSVAVVAARPGPAAAPSPDAGAAGRGAAASAVPPALSEAVRALPAPALLRLSRDFRLIGRASQQPPAGDWRLWLLMGGRGSGKTRAGAEWVQVLVRRAGPRTDLRIALVAETLSDAREVMVEGVSGLLSIAAGFRPDYESSRRRLVWPNGAVA